MQKLKTVQQLTCILAGILFFVSCSLSFASEPVKPAERSYLEGIEYSKRELWKEAVDNFSEAIRLDAKHSLAHANLGVALSQLGRHKAALIAFEKALVLGYDHPTLRYNRGSSFAKLNLLEDAEKEYLKALEMNPRMVLAEYELGIVYVLLNKNHKALEQVNKLYNRNRKLSQKLFSKTPIDYKIMSVDDGGTLSGRVALSGETPRIRAYHLINSPNVEFCTRISDGKGHRLLRDFTVSKSGGLQDTVVALKKVKKGKPFDPAMQVFHIDRCHSDKYVIGIKSGDDILVENTDPITHEVVTYESAGKYVNQLSNKTVLPKSSQVRNAFVRHDVDEFLIKCNLHPFLQTHAFLVDNPYYAITDKDGNFTIADIPPGTYEVVAWHPYIDNLTSTVTIEAQKQATVSFEYHSKDVRRKLYNDDIKGYRFNTVYDSGENFYGGKRIDDPVEILQVFTDLDERYESESGPGMIRNVPID